jgi:hypothetical protein
MHPPKSQRGDQVWSKSGPVGTFRILGQTAFCSLERLHRRAELESNTDRPVCLVSWTVVFGQLTVGGTMARTAWRTAMTGSLLLRATCSQASAADDIMVTKAPPAATTKALSQPAKCSSLEDFVVTACPLTWNGIMVYGTIDGGVTWLSHGAPFNGTSAVGADYLIQKFSNRAQWSLAPNGLTNSNIGIKGNEPFAPVGLLSSICRPGSILIPCNYPMDRTRWFRTAACRSPAKIRPPIRAGPGNFTIPWAIWASVHPMAP